MITPLSSKGGKCAAIFTKSAWAQWVGKTFCDNRVKAFAPCCCGERREGVEIGCEVVDQSVQIGRKIAALFGDIKDDFEKALDEAYGNGASGVSFFAGPDEEYLRRFKAYLDKRGFIVK